MPRIRYRPITKQKKVDKARLDLYRAGYQRHSDEIDKVRKRNRKLIRREKNLLKRIRDLETVLIDMGVSTVNGRELNG